MANRSGWKREPARHALAAKGIKTSPMGGHEVIHSGENQRIGHLELTNHVDDTWLAKGRIDGCSVEATGDYEGYETVIIVSFWVSKAGHNYGSQMLEELETYWKRRGIHEIKLDALPESVDFWLAKGFEGDLSEERAPDETISMWKEIT